MTLCADSVSERRGQHTRRLSSTVSVLAWAALLMAVGVVSRRFDDQGEERALGAGLPLLDSIPLTVGPWEGSDVPMDSRIVAAARTDAHVNRKYVHRESREVVDLYVAFTHRPINMLGHRPDVCYPANGWIAEPTIQLRLVPADQEPFDCLLHRFRRGADADGEQLFVANYYVLPSGITTDWNTFAGLQWRRQNAGATQDMFVAQIQVVGLALFPSRARKTMASVQEFAQAASPYIADALFRVGQKEAGTELGAKRP